jgi:hypothetical protein
MGMTTDEDAPMGVGVIGDGAGEGEIGGDEPSLQAVADSKRIDAVARRNDNMSVSRRLM